VASLDRERPPTLPCVPTDPGAGEAQSEREGAKRETNRTVSSLLRPLAWVGFFSYSLYVFHVLLERITFRSIAPHVLNGRNSSIACTFVFSVFGAYLCHRVFERPFLPRPLKRDAGPVAPWLPDPQAGLSEGALP
jgi:peptidoglycan/LPS O-acetylase OafA/YrhL